ncbi:hypothetical protein RvY_17383 [Ramazzottius varieornatus]|uniref:Uncharacterized protein n=1 Tax=Ramazzottius varieornatus TaxID=947166 RepID=A0A1D1W1Y0_RAMVA|nr:hypothetical protein RvY_17383 [Ramazzottius varieornatus]
MAAGGSADEMLGGYQAIGLLNAENGQVTYFHAQAITYEFFAPDSSILSYSPTSPDVRSPTSEVGDPTGPEKDDVKSEDEMVDDDYKPKKGGRTAIANKDDSEKGTAYQFFTRVETIMQYNPYQFPHGSPENQACWGRTVKDLQHKKIIRVSARTKENLVAYLNRHLSAFRVKHKTPRTGEELDGKGPDWTDRDLILSDLFDHVSAKARANDSKIKIAEGRRQTAHKAVGLGSKTGRKKSDLKAAAKSISCSEVEKSLDIERAKPSEADHVNQLKKTLAEIDQEDKRLEAPSFVGSPTSTTVDKKFSSISESERKPKQVGAQTKPKTGVD